MMWSRAEAVDSEFSFLSSCVTLGKSLKLSLPEVPYPQTVNKSCWEDEQANRLKLLGTGLA